MEEQKGWQTEKEREIKLWLRDWEQLVISVCRLIVLRSGNCRKSSARAPTVIRYIPRSQLGFYFQCNMQRTDTWSNLKALCGVVKAIYSNAEWRGECRRDTHTHVRTHKHTDRDTRTCPLIYNERDESEEIFSLLLKMLISALTIAFFTFSEIKLSTQYTFLNLGLLHCHLLYYHFISFDHHSAQQQLSSETHTCRVYLNHSPFSEHDSDTHWYIMDNIDLVSIWSASNNTFCGVLATYQSKTRPAELKS